MRRLQDMKISVTGRGKLTNLLFALVLWPLATHPCLGNDFDRRGDEAIRLSLKHQHPPPISDFFSPSRHYPIARRYSAWLTRQGARRPG